MIIASKRATSNTVIIFFVMLNKLINHYSINTDRYS